MNRLRTIPLLFGCCALVIAVTAAPSFARRNPRGPRFVAIPARIDKKSTYPDPLGKISNFQPDGATRTRDNAFFQTLGSIPDRRCAGCHEIRDGFSLSASDAQKRFTESEGTDPLFNPIDTATCPSDDVSTPAAQEAAYKLILNNALVRISLPIPLPPTRRRFEVTAVNDPYGCTTLTSPTSGDLSVYRRILPTTNLAFATTLMWDGREPSLAHAALDEALVHEQAAAPGPSAGQQTQIANFATGLFTAQVFDNEAGFLKGKPTQLTLQTPVGGSSSCASTSIAQRGGPEALAALARDFFVGINDPAGLDPCGTPFDDDVFNVYDSWLSLRPARRKVLDRVSIARGQALFNTMQFDISSISGSSKIAGQAAPALETCSFCHDSPNVGNQSAGKLFATGTTDPAPVGLSNVPQLPVFTLQCTDTNSPLFGQTFTVTDPGAALVTGACEDIGRIKVPILRGLAARAPYFHNGAAGSLADVVNFYDVRFNIGLSDQDKQDLVNFLGAL